jgi:cystathionine gamma-synthase
MKLCKALSLPEDHFAFPFLDPAIFLFAQAHAYSAHRKEHRLSPGELSYRIVDVGEGADVVRIYLVVFPLAKSDGAALIWGNPGIGVSTRLAEALLPAVDAGKVTPVAWDAGDDSKPIDISNAPEPTGVPEGKAHAELRERIVGLWKRASITPEQADLVKDHDVQLFPTGMAAIYRLHLALMRWRPGVIVPLGSIFHNTWHLHEEAPQGFKHFGRVDGAGKGLDEMEAYLEAEAKEGRKITYAFVEFPSNPIMVSADLNRLRGLADKFDFLLVVDDTLGSFCNIDLSSVADIVMTSTTKSFSGYADVMGGTLVLNPASRLYSSFKPVLEEHFRNEYYLGDAEKLLSNSEDYLERSTILNRNALTLATWLEELKTREPEYGITKILYPTTSDTLENYKIWMRKPTPEFTPGYGCLFSIEFGKKDDSKIFYDNLEVYIGPHLGAHQTLAICFNELVLGKDPEVAKYHSAYGATPEQIRIAVGLEGEDELKKVFEAALEKVKEAKRGSYKQLGVPSEGAVLA